MVNVAVDKIYETNTNTYVNMCKKNNNGKSSRR